MLKENLAVVVATLSILGMLSSGIFGYADLRARLAILEDHDTQELIKIQTFDAASQERDKVLRSYIENVGKSGRDHVREHDSKIGHDGVMSIIQENREEQIKTQSAVKFLGDKIDTLIEKVEEIDK